RDCGRGRPGNVVVRAAHEPAARGRPLGVDPRRAEEVREPVARAAARPSDIGSPGHAIACSSPLPPP
ncbi:hypothetical protein, partial [Saccharothrix hoggarensis]